MKQDVGAAGKIARSFIDSKLTPLIIIASIFLGLAAIYALPREEEPQIIVPMIDVFVQMRDAVDGFKAGVTLRSEYFLGIAFQQHDQVPLKE